MLAAEAELGGMIAENPPRFSKGNHGQIIGEKTLPSGITKKQSYEVQKINKHWEIAARVRESLEYDELKRKIEGKGMGSIISPMNFKFSFI